ncbi:MAG: hypothetical protein JRD89_18855 [Deltaproteobacteria bacterium]|nr:hypothetical protein [Deltaproteobacteria bacterium]
MEVYTEVARETGKHIGIECKRLGINLPVIINLGCSNFQAPTDKIVLNRDCRTSIDKVKMFKAFRRHGVKHVPFYDLRNPIDIFKALFNLPVILRPNFKVVKTKGEFLRSFMRYRFATKLIEKKREFRANICLGEVLNVKEKIPFDRKSLRWKQHNSKFERVERPDVGSLAVKAAEAVGLDVCGVDIIEDMKGELYVLETNSAPGMGTDTVQELIKTIYSKFKKSHHINEGI